MAEDLLLSPVLLHQLVAAVGQGVVLQAVLRHRPQGGVQFIAGLDPLQLPDALLLGLRQGAGVAEGLVSGRLSRGGVSAARLVHLLLQSGEVHQFPGLGVHIVFMTALWQVAEDSLGAVDLRQDVLQPQSEGPPEGLPCLCGGDGGLRPGDPAQAGSGQGIPGEAGHLIIGGPDGDAVGQG